MGNKRQCQGCIQKKWLRGRGGGANMDLAKCRERGKVCHTASSRRKFDMESGEIVKWLLTVMPRFWSSDIVIPMLKYASMLSEELESGEDAEQDGLE